jgi:hypothetical protein
VLWQQPTSEAQSEWGRETGNRECHNASPDRDADGRSAESPSQAIAHEAACDPEDSKKQDAHHQENDRAAAQAALAAGDWLHLLKRGSGHATIRDACGADVKVQVYRHCRQLSGLFGE